MMNKALGILLLFRIVHVKRFERKNASAMVKPK